MTTNQSLRTEVETVELTPSYKLPLAIIFLAIPLILLSKWLGGVMALFGFFLMFQTATLRLRFTPTALDIYRADKLIRQFPYTEWQNWRIFWNNVPILFYFKEVKSIHFLPIIFDPHTLKACLERYCPYVE